MTRPRGVQHAPIVGELQEYGRNSAQNVLEPRDERAQLLVAERVEVRLLQAHQRAPAEGDDGMQPGPPVPAARLGYPEDADQRL